MTSSSTPLHDILEDLMNRAKRAGADAADAVAATSMSVSYAQRLGNLETLERSEGRDLGLRVLIGKKQAIVSSNDWSSDHLDMLVDRAISMARVVPEDEHCGLAEPEQIFQGDIPDLQSFDPDEPDSETLMRRAAEAEEAALGVEGVTNSEGAEATWGHSEVALAATNGFMGHYKGSRHMLAASVIAGEGLGMETDYDFQSVVFGSDLKDPAEIGRLAGTRAVERLNPQKGRTASLPVVFDPRVASSLAGHLAGAINGSSIASGTSFLKNSLGERILPEGVYLVDDPHRVRGLASKPFDAEGLATHRQSLIDDGVLTTWVLDLATARKLGMQSTANAGRGTSSIPSPSTTNLYFQAGSLSPEALIGEIEEGFYVTSMMGHGVNGTTGDYSRGASGFWIEKGKIAYPVNEMTIAGNLKDMYLDMALANDLEFKGAVNAPTIRIGSMTVAGA